MQKMNCYINNLAVSRIAKRQFLILCVLFICSFDSHHNDVCDSCQAGISSHQCSEEHSTGAKGQHCLGGDPK